ncbi:MAG TPA: GNAT family N-acetyltransferase [Planctomycetota bacterium]|nr:GNAT family N-acetyltransferase [Planctomycetota bacterium]
MKRKAVQLNDGRKATIRPLGPADAELLFRCFQGYGSIACRNFAPHPFSREIAEDICSRVASDTTSYRVIVTEGDAPDEEPLGYAFLWQLNQPVPLLGIGLIDRAAGGGLGRQVMECLLEQARQQGHSKVSLSVMVRNARARRLYEALGFTYVNGQTWDENGKGWSLKMEKRLDGRQPA